MRKKYLNTATRKLSETIKLIVGGEQAINRKTIKKRPDMEMEKETENAFYAD